MRCRYCNDPFNGKWRVELGLYVCDMDYEYPPLRGTDILKEYRYRVAVRERPITK